ncbi:MAG: acyl-CoA/acyl-ACP dehydrogenase [Actinobacteria bacterium]|nr:acyl-CoA/acyl-ACP dehydrogenase [Actinomycetota bacterium]
MDVAFSENQELLRKSAHEFLTEQVSKELLARVAEAPDELDALWRRIAGLGWTGIAIGEEHGGLGLGLVDLSIVAEEMGKVLFPGPWLGTVCLAAEAIKQVGTAEQKKRWLPEIASGNLRATLGVYGNDGRLGEAHIGVTSNKGGDGYRLQGRTTFVPDAGSVDLLLVAANLEGEPALVALEPGKDSGLSVTQEPSLDPTRPFSVVDLDSVVVGLDALVGGEPCGWKSIETVIDRAAAVLSAEMVGGSQRMLDDSVAYSKIRHQFGRPIGSFQGVSHRCADMLLEIESARSLAYYAAWCCDEEPARAPEAVAAAKAAATEAFRSCTAQAIQIHGGIGFTWEAGLHWWYRRAFASGGYLGDAVYHRERVASLVL